MHCECACPSLIYTHILMCARVGLAAGAAHLQVVFSAPLRNWGIELEEEIDVHAQRRTAGGSVLISVQ